jgi:DNA-directed RNA polymerase subunit RPC12/RpoP
MIKCIDCGKPYNSFGLDTVLPRSQWLEIMPDEDGILCANCIVDRWATIPGATVAHMIIEITPRK